MLNEHQNKLNLRITVLTSVLVCSKVGICCFYAIPILLYPIVTLTDQLIASVENCKLPKPFKTTCTVEGQRKNMINTLF